MPPMYDPEAVKPMEDELVSVGVQPLRTAEEVDAVLNKEGTQLIMINSVCGCAAGNARPGVSLALQSKRIPDNLYTVFAGVDMEAVQRTREHMPEIPPSSPCVAVFKDGKPAFVLERRHIEAMDANMISDALSKAFEEHCTGEGPSISPEEFEKIKSVKMCGSNIPLFGQN